MLKHVITSITLILMVLSSSSSALADGGFFYNFKNQLRVLNQNQQNCFINYNGNIQNMILSIKFDNSHITTDAVWIFPVPSEPSKIKINILNSQPNFNVYYLEDYYLKNISDIFSAVSASQLIHLPLYYIFLPDLTLSSNVKPIKSINHVTIHDKIEKFGMVTELISTTDLNSLKNYFNSKKLNFPEKFNFLLNNYFKKDYSFVISYIVNPKQINDNIGIFISFPSSKIFFPLLLTSIYDHLLFPINIILLGHYQPELYQEIKNHCSLNHYFSNNFTVNEPLKPFFFGESFIDYLKLTTININSEAVNFKDDIWINPNEPITLSFANFVIYHKYLTLFIMFAIISSISSILAGGPAFGFNKTNVLKFIIIGISNFGSILLVPWITLTLFKPTSKLSINYKILILIPLLLSAISTISLFFIFQTFEAIFNDMGLEKLPLYTALALTHNTLYHFIVFIALFLYFVMLIYAFVYHNELGHFLILFIFWIYILSSLSNYFFYYGFNDFYQIIQNRVANLP